MTSCSSSCCSTVFLSIGADATVHSRFHALHRFLDPVRLHEGFSKLLVQYRAYRGYLSSREGSVRHSWSDAERVLAGTPAGGARHRGGLFLSLLDPVAAGIRGLPFLRGQVDLFPDDAQLSASQSAGVCRLLYLSRGAALVCGAIRFCISRAYAG